MPSAKIVTNVNPNTLTIPTKRLILDVWPGPGGASAEWYIKVLKSQTKIKVLKEGRQVKMESF